MSAELPAGWAEVKLEQVAQINPPGASTVVPDGQPVTFVPMAAVEALTGRMDVSVTRAFGDVKRGFTRFRDGDVLFAKITPCMENGKIAVAQGLREGVGCGSTEFHVLRPNQAVMADYLRHYLVQPGYRQEAQRNMQGAVGQQRLPADYLRDSQLPLAPVPEQQRIVSRIEELFSEIDDGERALERAARLVERYRQSVLKAAVTGELTRAWRELHCTEQSASAFGDLPSGWRRVTVEELCPVQTGATPKRGEPRYYDNGTIPWVTSGAVNASRITEATELITPTAIAETNAKVFPSGTLIVAMYGEGKTRGKVSVLGIAAATNQACAALLCAGLESEVQGYLRLYFEQHYDVLRSQAAGGVQPNLNLSLIKQTMLPLPPLPEAREIGNQVAVLLSQADALKSELTRRQKAAIALRQSILQAAFSGQLVPQDPGDEPAAALLARIACQTAQATDAPAVARRRGRRQAA